jgi:hypothetical protein
MSPGILARLPGDAADALPAGLLGRVVGELTRVHGCHTVILFGSRARGDGDAGSDVDLFCVGEDVVDGPLPRTIDGFDFDIWRADERSVEADLDEYLKIEDGMPLVQRARYGDALLGRIKQRVSAGPPSLSANERAQRLGWLSRMTARSDRDDDEARYRLIWLISELPRIRLELADRYWLGAKRSLVLLADLDPDFLALYRSALDKPTADSAAACTRYLIDSLTPSV